ncbi:MAG: cell wall hydrolase [Lachnospiraceae bacterium]|nr:cell wall hydrolase [Lachnospiraceae bacterium]MBQ6482744.1 cell wall hydrolase [Anaerolineaceae bacterium]
MKVRRLVITALIVLILSLIFSRKILAVENDHAAELQYEIDQETLDIFAKLVFAEAGNQGLLGKRYVVDVVLNRVDSKRFKESTIIDVIYAPNQFSPVKSKSFLDIVPTEDCYKAIALELGERTNSEILFFNGRSYIPRTTPVLIEGDHYFSK